MKNGLFKTNIVFCLQCQGNVRSTRKETTHIRRLYDDNEKFRNNVSGEIKSCHSNVQVKFMNSSFLILSSNINEGLNSCKFVSFMCFVCPCSMKCGMANTWL